MDYAILKVAGQEHNVPLSPGAGMKEVKVRKVHWCSDCGAEIAVGDTALSMRFENTACAGAFRQKRYSADYYCGDCYTVKPGGPGEAKKAEEQKTGAANADAGR